MQSFRPLHDRVLVRRIPTDDKIGRIHIPASAKEKHIEAEIMAVGTGKTDEKGKVHPVDVIVGDRVLFGKYSGTEIKLNGEDHLILREDEILGIVKNTQ